MEYTNVNYIYVLINSKNDIYDMSTDFEKIEESCKSFNRMTESFDDELPFTVIELELGTKIKFD